MEKQLFNKFYKLKKESDSWDYKRELILKTKTDKFNLIKDFLAFANYGGGHILLGIEDSSFNLYNQIPIDPATIGDIVESNLGFNIPFEISYFDKIFSRIKYRVGIIVIYPSNKMITCPKDFHSENNKIIVGKNDILTRRNTKSTKANSDDISKILNRLKNNPSPNPNSPKILNKLQIYESSISESKALWDMLEDKFEFNSKNAATKFRGFLFHSQYNESDFAKIIGITTSELEEILIGKSLPDLSLLLRMSKVLNIDVNFFFQNDYYGRYAFWRDDIFKMTILKRISPSASLDKLSNIDRLLGMIVLETAENILLFSDFILKNKIENPWKPQQSSFFIKFKDLPINEQNEIKGQLQLQYYKVIEQSNLDLSHQGLTPKEKLISTWFYSNELYLIRIFVESIKDIKIISKDKFQIRFHFWEELKSLKIKRREYDGKNFKLVFSK